MVYCFLQNYTNFLLGNGYPEPVEKNLFSAKKKPPAGGGFFYC